MKNSIRTFVVMSGLTLSACGASTSLTGSGSSASSVASSINEITIQDSTKTVIADVVSVGEDEANVWMPTQKVYAQVMLSTGQYYSANIYYSATGCTGNPASSFVGSVNKSIVYGNSVYYMVTSEVASFSFLSYWNGSVCTNLSSALANAGVLTVTTQPYNFTPLSPISLNF